MAGNIEVYLAAFDDHVRRNGYATLPEGEGLLMVLEHCARQLGIPHMTDADRPAPAEEENPTPEPYQPPEGSYQP